MTLLQALFSPPLLTAGVVHLLLLAALWPATVWLDRRTREVALTHWLLEHLGYPLLRALVIVVFVLLAYPALFGLEAAPARQALLAAEPGRWHTLLNWVFLASLLLPVVPVLGAIQALILPLQGMVAAALLFSWLAQALGAQAVSLWPGARELAVISLAALVSHGAARWVAGRLGAELDRALNLADDGEALVFESVVLMFQLPVLLLYGLGLGRQLTA